MLPVSALHFLVTAAYVLILFAGLKVVATSSPNPGPFRQALAVILF